jgi:hypothetical protein
LACPPYVDGRELSCVVCSIWYEIVNDVLL